MSQSAIRGVDVSHEILFNALTSMTRVFAKLAADSDPQVFEKLDELLAQGWVARVEFSLGSAGPLGLSLVMASLDGKCSQLVSVDAPPSARPFRFNGLDA